MIYKREGSEEEYSLRHLPPGAMYFADWMPDWMKGEDGHCVMVRTPGGMWTIDGPATNCTRPEDREHKCWCRHGTPPKLTVDKNCLTCQAGGGSIVSGSYHGFLREGVFT